MKIIYRRPIMQKQLNDQLFGGKKVFKGRDVRPFLDTHNFANKDVTVLIKNKQTVKYNSVTELHLNLLIIEGLETKEKNIVLTWEDIRTERKN